MSTLVSIRAHAATITVSNAGTDAPNCGAASTPCKTIKFALAMATNNDTINVVEGQYAESLIVSKSVTITGVQGNASPSPVVSAPTAVIDGVGTDRVFTINRGVTVSMSNLTIQNAKSTADGAAIANLGTLTVSNSTIQNNSLGKFGHEKCAPCEGGGISNQGTMILINVFVSGNSANGGAGGNFFGGVYIPNDIGGGIYNSGMLTVTDSTITSNIAGYGGGGIENDGTLVLNKSTISKNTGGGIYNDSVLTVTNSTIGQNKAAGILNYSCNARTTLTDVTVASNESDLSNIPLPPGSGPDAVVCTQFNSTMTLNNSIVANSGVGANCTGKIISRDSNLDSGSTCGFHQPHDLSSKNPLLGPLAANASGFPLPGTPVLTDTYALLPGSPAIDADGTRGGCPATDQRRVSRPQGKACDCPATDQRGVSRPQGKACDIGSYERIQ
jgi:hypothetical protein